MSATKSRFSRGGDEAEEMSKSSGGGGGRRRPEFFKLEPGAHDFLRYLMDQPQWYNSRMHTGVPTKAKPKDWPADSNWPSSMPATCRYDQAFAAVEEAGLPAIHTDCYICDSEMDNSYGKRSYPVARHWTLAVLRDEVIGTAEMAAAGKIQPDQVGTRVGFKDRLRQVEVPKKDDKGDFVKSADGSLVMESVTERAIVVVNQPMKNYFGGLNTMYSVYKTLCDRDYQVTRYGEGRDTDYRHVPLDTTPDLKPGTEKWKRYEQAIEEQGDAADIEAIIEERASDEYFALFFDPTKEAPSRSNGDGQKATGKQETPAQSQGQLNLTKPSAEPSEDMVASMRQRLSNPGGAPSETPAPQGAADFDS